MFSKFLHVCTFTTSACVHAHDQTHALSIIYPSSSCLSLPPLPHQMSWRNKKDFGYINNQTYSISEKVRNTAMPNMRFVASIQADILKQLRMTVDNRELETTATATNHDQL